MAADQLFQPVRAELADAVDRRSEEPAEVAGAAGADLHLEVDTRGGRARGRDALVIEDDYDGEYRYHRQPVGALQAIDPDRVVYCGSAAKTLGPGWRLAWMALPPHLVEPVVTAKFHADAHTQTLGQLVLADVLARPDAPRRPPVQPDC